MAYVPKTLVYIDKGSRYLYKNFNKDDYLLKIMEQQIWINEAMKYAKTVVGIVYGGRFWKNEEKREWVELTKDACFLEGTPPKGTVILNTDDIESPSIIASDTVNQIILESKYPDNPAVKYREWFHNYHKRETLDTNVSEMIHSNRNTDEIVSMVIDTIFSDVETNPEKKINELREEWL